MKRESVKTAETEELVVKKSKLTIAKFFQQFNTLDMQGYGGWPLSVKITCCLFIFLFVSLLGYFFVVQPKLSAIEAAEAQQQSLLSAYKEKDSKLRNLKQYQDQLQQMESNFNQQLAQLPKETEIPSLVEDIHQSALQSGLKIKNIRLENEIQQDFFIEQPILIEAQGDYHAFGQFVSTLAELPRIVTLHDFVISAQDIKGKAEVPIVEYSIKSKTYRYVGRSDQAQADDNVKKTSAGR